MTQWHTLKLAGLAGGLLCAANPAHALSFGEATVRSALGERLVAEIPLSANDTTPTSCFVVRGDGYVPGLYRLERRRTALIIRTTQAVREPLLSFTLSASCAGEARLSRRYDLFVDPASRVSEAQRVIAALNESEPDRRSAPVRTNTRRQQPAATTSPSGGYTVNTGDTLWDIAGELGTTGPSRWALIDEIVASNPNAFINGDADRLISGAVLSLPRSVKSAGSVAVVEETIVRNTPAVAFDGSGATQNDTVEIASANAAAETNQSTRNGQEIEDTQRTAALLSVLSQPSSPFKTEEAELAPITPVVPASTQAVDGVPTPIETDSRVADVALLAPPDAKPSWGARLGALLAGICIAIAGYVAYQLMLGIAARKRRIARSRNLQPTRRPTPARLETAPIPTAARSAQKPAAPNTAKQKPEYIAEPEHVVEFEAQDRLATIDYEFKPKQAPDLDLEIGATTFSGIEEVDWMDSDNQNLLEQDYEAEMSRTQQIQKELAEAALKLRADIVEQRSTTASTEDDTVNMPTAEYEVSVEELDLADAAIAEFTASLTVEDDLGAAEDSQRTASLDVAELETTDDPDSTEVMPPAKRAGG
ncbi:MAG: hypothetical protein AAFR91_13815 [Pseudomonadota bacterium]